MIDSTELVHRAAISDVIFAYARSLDRHDWHLLRSILMDEVDTDFTAATGQPPAKLQAEQLVQGLQHLLGREGLKPNILAPITPTKLRNQRQQQPPITWRNTFYLTRQAAKSFIVHGYYTWHLNFSSDEWRINGIKIHVDWATGTPNILNM